MKRVLFTFICLFCVTAITFGQGDATKKADKYFENLSYIRAAEAYESLLKKDTTVHILRRLGDCYYFNSKMEEASQWYGVLFSNFDTDSIPPEYLFKYGQALRGVGNYEASDKWIESFSEKQKNDARGQNFTETEVTLKDLKPAIKVFELTNVSSVNTEGSDFGATFYNDGIIFASTKPQSRLIKRKHTWNNKEFLDLYFFNLKDSIASEKTELDALNSIYHESSVSFSPDGKTIYFTRNNSENRKLKKGADGISHLKLFKAEWIDDEWQNITELPFNNENYSVGHPAVSSDGKRLYFVSDMPGSIGQTDIFYVRINDDNSFGPIETLGLTINTEGREMFPFVENDQLYFASDGHFGLGGLDVFVSQQSDGVFQKPINLKAPINSKSDDFAFVFNANLLKGFVSSNREGGMGSDDIYAFSYQIEEVVIEKKPCKQEISGIVVDKKFGAPLSNAKIVLTDSEGLIVSEFITGASGKFSYFLPCNKTYKITASKEYYKPDSNTFKTTEAMSLELDLGFKLDVIDDFTYNDRNELMIRIDPIFFDYNKSEIRPDAALELDKIVSVMKRFPKLTVESTSHTDARGRASYNERLSDRRAQSTVRYIVSKGISPERITGRGYGESKLVNDCSDGVKCTAEEHQANRRSEFLITNISELGIAMKIVEKIEEPIEKDKETKKEKTYTVQAGDTLYSIAVSNGMTVKELKDLNNLTSNTIVVGQILKLK